MLAKILLSVGDLDESLAAAQRAADFFNVTAKMPRHAAPANALVAQISKIIDDQI